jgi:hypothetical protein
LTIAVTRGKRLYRIDLTPGIRLTLQRELGAALTSLADPDPPRAVFMTGHGELREGGGPEHGGSLLIRSLTQAGFTTTFHDAATVAPPPPQAVVIVAGPLRSLGDRDVARLDQHLLDGGGLLVLTDDRTPDDLRQWLRRHGLALGARPPVPDPRQGTLPPADIILSLRQHQAGQEVRFPYHNLLIGGPQFHPQHPISGPLAAERTQVLSPWSTPVWLVDPAVLGDSAEASALRAAYRAVGTAPFGGAIIAGTLPSDAWTKPRAAPLQDPEGLNDAPPLPIAAAVEYMPQATSLRAGIGGRLVVWGSRQVASDGILAQTAFANDGLLRHSVDWLARRSPPTDIPPAESAAFQVQASDNLLGILTAVLLAVLPCLCLGGAMLTWWDRR